MCFLLAYSDTDISRISSTLGEAITATIAGQEGWKLVGELFLDFFPGATFSFSNFSPRADVPCTAFGVNWNPDFIQAYEEHFAAINPWISLWANRPAGDIMTSEGTLPASALKGRPFYEEWLKPHRDVDAAAGIKLRGESGWVLHTAIHYPLRFATDYDRAMVAVLERIRPVMSLAVDSSIQIANGWVNGASCGALVPIEDRAGFVIDVHRHLHRATPAAERVLGEGSLCFLSNGALRLGDRDADRWLGEHLFHRRAGGAGPVLPRIFVHQERPWRADLWLLPKPTSMVPVVAPDRFLVVLTDPEAGEHRDGMTHLARLYRLTGAEARVCAGLVTGQTVAEFAEAAGLSHHTVRSQLKSAMRKMGCHRQGELIGRIIRYSQ